MGAVSIHVGKKIRMLRKMKNISLADFSKLINKSVATLSKYENGSISIDIDTLFEISEALGTDIGLLTDYTPPHRAKNLPLPAKTIFGEGDVLYMYNFDTYTVRLIQSLIKLYFNHSSQTCEAELFMNVSSYENYQLCKHYYCGGFRPFDIISNFTFENQANSIEQLNITVSNPLNTVSIAMGLMMGISSTTLQPSASKVLLSKAAIREEQMVSELLSFSKEDISMIKKRSMITVGNPK